MSDFQELWIYGGESCADQIFTVRMLLEEHVEMGKKLFEAFIDLKEAYDRVNRRMLW